MSDEMEKIKGWKYDFAWRQLENAQVSNERLDNKAMSLINFSGLMIPIIMGILLYISDKPLVKSWFCVFITESLIFLIVSMFFAFTTLWLRDQGVIRTVNQFKNIEQCNFMRIIGGTSQDLANWQKTVVDAGDDKIKYLIVSSAFFAFALMVIFLGGTCLLFF